jgi:aminoglycoside phosphotransferase (APT) family kinase protein
VVPVTDEYVDRLVDETALTTYLETALGPASSVAVKRHDEGHSNETLFVEWDDRNLVLRRPPAGETADTAHDVLREFRVIDALQDTAVPVPETVLSCEDEAVIGGEFYLMAEAAGDVIRDEEPDRFAAPEHRRRIGEELVDGLVAVHEVDYEAVGLGDFGHPEGFTERQVERWQQQVDWASEVTAQEREVPELDAVGEWLTNNVPEDHPQTLVHGDYKLDNVLFGPGTPPELTAVFDWELSTLGDPRTDLGWLLLFWHDEADPDPALSALMPTFTARDGYPTRDELVERYEARAGVAFDHPVFYRTLAGYKMCALGEMFYRRYLDGNAADPLYPEMGEGVPTLAKRTLEIAEGERPI